MKERCGYLEKKTSNAAAKFNKRAVEEETIAKGDDLMLLAPRTLIVLSVFVLLIGSGLASERASAQSGDASGILLVNAKVNGKSASLLLDTGSERSCLDDGFAAELGLKPIATRSIQRPYSTETGNVLRVGNLSVGSSNIRDVEMITIDLTSASKALGLHIDGVLGSDILRRYRITLNFSTGSVKIDLQSHPQTNGFAVKLHAIGSRYFVHVTIQGVPMELLLDTGTTLSSISQSGWDQLTHKWIPTRLIEGVRSSGNVSGSQLVCIPQMAVGRIVDHNFPVRVQPPTPAGIFADPGFNGLLGSDFLKQFVVTLDLANDTMYLSKARRYKVDVNRFSTIGIQFIKDSLGTFTIVAIWTPSPASNAGLEVGDQIVAVNGLNTTPMDLEGLSRQIHGKSGQEVQLVIRSRGQERTIPLAISNLLCRDPAVVSEH